MDNIMACVTLQNTCEKLINKASSLKTQDDNIFVLHVAKNGESFMNSQDSGFILDYLYTISQNVGANMTVIHSDNVFDTIAEFVDKNKITKAVFGMPGKNDTDNGFIEKIKYILKDKCQIILVQKGE